jgi:hypothetical protein
MRTRATLLVDASINLVLGILLLGYTPGLAALLGVPLSSTRFYPSILGAVFIGITVALVVEALRPPKKELIGLGLVGAVSINLCGGLTLAMWLLLGQLALPLRGQILLWTLVVVLVGISSLELLRALRPSAATPGQGRS